MKQAAIYIQVLITVCVSSCTTVYFDKPQPVNTKNLNKVPIAFQGTWVQNQDSTVITDTDFRAMTKYFYTLPKREIDTSTTIKTKDGFIYDVNDSANRYPYSVKGDSIEVTIPELHTYVLSDSVLLRPLSQKELLVNIKTDDNWWEVYLIELIEEGSILVRSIKVSDLEKLEILNPNNFSLREPHKDVLQMNNQERLEADFSKEDLLLWIGAKGFSDTVMVMYSKHKVLDE